jgi:hypothetical protein
MVETLGGRVGKSGDGQSRATTSVAAASNVIEGASGSPSPRQRKVQQLGIQSVSVAVEVKKWRRLFVFLLWNFVCDYAMTCSFVEVMD